jgi:molybdopterin-guanine dinucleotide biosynthesis protein A
MSLVRGPLRPRAAEGYRLTSMAGRVADSRPPVTAIVLAGGRSARFGGPKLEARVDGATLLEHAVAAVAAVAGEVIVALPERGTEPPSLAGVPGRPVVRFVRDVEPFGGPLVGLMGALAAARTHTAIVVGGDMPRLAPAVLRAMLDRLASPAGASLRPVEAIILGGDAGGNGGPNPLPLAVSVPAGLRAGAAALGAGHRSLKALLANLVVGTLEAAEWRSLDPSGETLLDVDTPDDLARPSPGPRAAKPRST